MHGQPPLLVRPGSWLSLHQSDSSTDTGLENRQSGKVAWQRGFGLWADVMVEVFVSLRVAVAEASSIRWRSNGGGVFSGDHSQ